jgi:hypothetical protein
VLLDDASYEVTAYAVIVFSKQDGALAGCAALPTASQSYLIPVPPLTSHSPTPEAFGTPIQCRDFSFKKDSWISVLPQKVIWPEKQSVSPF